MTFMLDKVVPWGRSFTEYVDMFALSDDDLGKHILGCGDGPSSFNCICTRKGGHVVSIDPLYKFSAAEIQSRIKDTYAEIIEQTAKNKHEFVWNTISSVEQLGAVRMAAMNDFLSDYEQGRKQGCYIESQLPNLPFADRQFDIALSSHFLFLYSSQLSEEFHVESIYELCRVATEARIFPLLELGSKKSRHLQKIYDILQQAGFTVSIENVAYEFQKGGNEMMRVVVD